MANIKISQLPQYSASVNPDIYFVNNNSGETETTKIKLSQFNGMTSTNGNNAIQSNSWLTSLGSTASTESAIAIGNGAEATSPYSIAIGYMARNTNRDGTRNNYIAIGTNSQAVQESFALGTDAKAFGADTCSVGKNAGTFGNSSLAMGKDSLAYSTGGLAVGRNSFDAANNYGTALGGYSRVDADYGTAVGYNARAQGIYSLSLGGSGNTNASTSTNATVIGGVDNVLQRATSSSIISSIRSSQNTSLPYDTTNVQMLGCVDSELSNMNNSVALGLSGRTIIGGSDTTYVEKLYVFGNATFQERIVNDPGTIAIDVFNEAVIEINATGGTYTLQISPSPTAVGTPELTLLINYASSGATIVFDGSGQTQWKWGNGAGAPTFTPGTRSIIKMAAWTGNDLWEVSRSMNMS